MPARCPAKPWYGEVRLWHIYAGEGTFMQAIERTQKRAALHIYAGGRVREGPFRRTNAALSAACMYIGIPTYGTA